ncbi:sensor histidine kinase [Paraflavitalea pollutisoli]|uniref:sensor histidine kinase n=1 Tax=Paraflavitalea pollutisoli TaxID=3034143 RepID=UPI0023EDC73A|nr:histidine kinase [Paraflavitalea sp. H1-2-19X]
MLSRRRLIFHPVIRFTQHLVFWVLSFVVFVQLFKSSAAPLQGDFLYAGLFHLTILPAVYINLYFLLPRFMRINKWVWYLVALVLLVTVFSWLNYSFFQDWSQLVLPDYFFISYFSWWEVCLFFVVYIGISSLLKLSKSWFTVLDMQRRLLQVESEKAQMELDVLREQVNPHFFLNTLNGIYSMTLDKDERLPETILQLSQLMKYFLYESGDHFVLLEKEWQIAEDYISLQRIRSGQQLQLYVVVEGEIREQRIAPLLLITFLENAFKHGAKGSAGHVRIDVNLEVMPQQLRFCVKNTRGQAAVVGDVKHHGVGLGNVRRRLDLLYSNRYQLDIQDLQDDFVVTLELNL